MIPKNKFSKADLKELKTFLFSDQVPDECMDIFTLHGYLTCLAIGPDTIMPSKWLPEIWGDEMVWDDMEETEHTIGLIMSYFNSIVKLFTNNPKSFEPLTFFGKTENENATFLQDWCSGFMRAMDLNYDSWDPLIKSDSDSDLLVPLAFYGTEKGRERLTNEKIVDEPPEYWAKLIPLTVIAIHKFWLPYRKDVHQSTHQAISKKVGRNDPCHCGSGKKFKNCCMN